jgi:hypothetical protein
MPVKPILTPKSSDGGHVLGGFALNEGDTDVTMLWAVNAKQFGEKTRRSRWQDVGHFRSPDRSDIQQAAQHVPKHVISPSEEALPSEGQPHPAIMKLKQRGPGLIFQIADVALTEDSCTSSAGPSLADTPGSAASMK